MSQIRKIVDRKLRLHIIGKTLGECPRTGESIDIRTAVFVLDRDGDPYMALSQRGWREIVDAGNVQALADNGITVDPATVKDGDLRDRSEPSPFEVVGQLTIDVE